jgi:peptidoglycan hydrolase CwlO-like protein
LDQEKEIQNLKSCLEQLEQNFNNNKSNFDSLNEENLKLQTQINQFEVKILEAYLNLSFDWFY